jgi:pimeloyl-ACP methyl ester carboxylesterase
VIEAAQHRFAMLDQVRLHYVEAAPARDDAPLVLLLHGFPEFWYAWRYQIEPLSRAGLRVVAPDLRGFNLSDKPKGVANYDMDVLVDDVRQLVASLGHDDAIIVGHDLGGLVAWHYAMRYPEATRRLVVMNCPHPAHQLAMMTNAKQLRRSWYILFFQLPKLPQWGLQRGGFSALRRLFSRDPKRPGAYSEEDIDRYVEAFGHGTAGAAINWYRALLRHNPFAMSQRLRPIDVPTQVIWGRRDSAICFEYAEPPAKWVWDVRVDVIEQASHWVQCDAPERVNELILDFVGCRSQGRA